MKKFKNIWSMGVIICIILLVALYLIKLIFPQFVVGVAELESVVMFGNYIDTHKWAYYLFNFIVVMFAYYFYCCACCRVKRIGVKGLLIIAIVNIILFVIQEFLPIYYTCFNYISLIITPCIICKINKIDTRNIIYSVATVFTMHLLAQFLSLEIRDINIMISYPNSATFTILLIDAYIWLILLYNYFNFRKKEG